MDGPGDLPIHVARRCAAGGRWPAARRNSGAPLAWHARQAAERDWDASVRPERDTLGRNNQRGARRRPLGRLLARRGRLRWERRAKEGDASSMSRAGGAASVAASTTGMRGGPETGCVNDGAGRRWWEYSARQSPAGRRRWNAGWSEKTTAGRPRASIRWIETPRYYRHIA